MEDIRIVINRSSRLIKSISKRILGNDGENLQENLVFSFEDEFVNGQARLEYQLPDDTTGWLALTEGEETYQIPVRNVLMSEGTIYFQLVVTEGTDETSIPLFKSNIFKMKINESLNTVEIEAPEGYASWLDLANTKLNQMDNFDINVSKVGDTATIKVTNRLGETSSASIKDGEIGPTGPQGIQGVPGYTPVKGVDYYTESEKQEMINYIINDSESEFNQNAAQKTTEFNNNAGSKTLGFNQNATNKTNDFNTNATNKTTTFDNNASAKTTTFNENASSKTTDFNSNANTKTTDFDTHANGKVTEYNSNHTSKLQEYNDNAQNKIDEYDAHVQELNDEIEYLQDQVADLSDNQLTYPAEGTEIYVTDSARARLNDFRFTKESSQVTTTGKQLFDKNNISAGKSVSATTGSLYNDSNSFATSYIDIHDLSSISWNGKSGGNTTWGSFYNENKQFLAAINSIVENTISIPNDAYYVRFGFHNEYLDILQIEEGSTPTNFEPYTGGEASPSSDYPQEVEVVEGYENLFDKTATTDNSYILSNGSIGSEDGICMSDYISVIPNQVYYFGNRGDWKSAGTYDSTKTFITRSTINDGVFTIPSGVYFIRINLPMNLKDTFQITKGNQEHPYVPYGNNYVDVKITGKNLWGGFVFSKTNSSVNFTYNKNGTITASGTASATALSMTSGEATDYYKTLPAGTYTISGGANVNQRVQVLDSSGNELASSGSTSSSFILSETKQIWIRIRIASGEVVNTTYSIQLEEGSKSTSFEPYQESIVPIPLNGNFIGGIGDYLDELIVDKFGKCYLDKVITKIDSYNGETITTEYMSTTGGLDIGATIYYVTPSQLIDLNYTIDLKTFKGVSNITNSEEANMKIRYVQDINTIISNIQNAILEIGGE